MREVDSQSRICIGNGCYLDLDGDILIKDSSDGVAGAQRAVTTRAFGRAVI